MAKKQKTLNKDKNKKIPFNVLRKGAMALAMAGVMVASPFMFTGCSAGEKGDTGPEGAPGTTWYSGEDYNELENDVRVGDFFFDTDDNIIYQKTATGWLKLSSVAGKDGEKGDKGVGISDVNVIYEYDNQGNLWAKFTITYTEGEPHEFKSLVPKRVESVRGLALKNTNVIEKIVKLAKATDVPELYAEVMFDDLTTGLIKLTDDMFITDGIDPLDFTKEGEQEYQINCQGVMGHGDIEVVDLATLGASTNCMFPGGNSKNFRTTTQLKDVYVELDFNSIPEQPSDIVYAPLSMVVNKYVNYKTEEESNTIDMSEVGEYEIVLKDNYKMRTTGDEPGEITLYMNVYDAAVCTVQQISVQAEYGLIKVDYQKELNDALKNTIKATPISVSLYEENADGVYNYNATIESLNFDWSKLDTSVLGYQYIPYTYQIEGQTGYFEDELVFKVVADTSEFTKVGDFSVASGQEAQMGMFNNVFMHGMSTMTLYEENIAEVEYDNGEYQTTYQYAYDYSEVENGKLCIYDSITGGNIYYAIDETEEEISFYSNEGTASKYSLQMEIEDELYKTTLDVYGTTGVCETKVAICMPAGSMPGIEEDTWLDYSFIDCEWETDGDDQFLIFGGRKFKVTESTEEINSTTYTILEEVTE